MLPEIKKFFGLSSPEHHSRESPAVYCPGRPFNDAPSPPASTSSRRRTGSPPNYQNTMRSHPETPKRAAPSQEERALVPHYGNPSDAVVIGKPVSLSGGNMPHSNKPGSHNAPRPRNTLAEQPHNPARNGRDPRPVQRSLGAKNPLSGGLRLGSSRGDNVPAPKYIGFSDDGPSPKKKRQKTYHSRPSSSAVVDLTDEDHEPTVKHRERRNSEACDHFASYGPSRSPSGHSIPSAASRHFSPTEFHAVEARMDPKINRNPRPSPDDGTEKRRTDTMASVNNCGNGSGSLSQPMEVSDDEGAQGPRKKFIMDTLLESIDEQSKAPPIKSRLTAQGPRLGAEQSSEKKGYHQNPNGTQSHRHRSAYEFQKSAGQSQNGKDLDRANLRQRGPGSTKPQDDYGSEDELQLTVATPSTKQREQIVRGFHAERQDGTRSQFFSGGTEVDAAPPHLGPSPGSIARTSRSDIKPSQLTSNKGPKSLPKPSRNIALRSNHWQLELFKIPGSPSITGTDMWLVHQPEDKLYQVSTKEGPRLVAIPVGKGQVCIDESKVTKALFGSDGSTLVVLEGVRDDTGIYRRFMQFADSDAVQDFRKSLSKSSIKAHEKDPLALKKMLEKADEHPPRNPTSEPVDLGLEDELLQSRNNQLRQATIERSHDQEHTRPRTGKMISRMRPDARLVEPSTRSSRASYQREDLDTITYSAPSTARNARFNNGTNHHDMMGITVEDSPSESEKWPPIQFPPEWKHPLVYPPTGRNRAQVDYSDLDKLDDGEFLNDSIISFYMTWAAKQAEEHGKLPEKRVYWYNTHFYTTMAGASRGINYAAVQRWTSKVDIFSYDYVVIPINESMHWYLAVVCNLPKIAQRSMLKDKVVEKPEVSRGETPEDSLASKVNAILRPQAQDVMSDSAKEAESAVDLMEIDEMVRSDGYTGVEKTEEQLDSPENDKRERLLTPQPSTLGARQSPINIDHAEEQDKAGLQTSGQQPSPKGKKGRKKQVSSLRKYDPEQPVIILFDSLNESHPRTTRNIKEYLIEEGKAKRGLELGIKDFQGMTAKNIPQQDNWVDCGVYVCLYFQKFIDDPEQLVHKILQRELDAVADWPDMRPWKTRRDIVELLTRLQSEQEERRKEERSKRLKEKKRLEGEKNDSSGSKPVSKQSSPDKAAEPEQKAKDQGSNTHLAVPSPAPPARMSSESEPKASFPPSPERRVVGRHPAVVIESPQKHSIHSPEAASNAEAENVVAASPARTRKRKSPLQEPRTQDEAPAMEESSPLPLPSVEMGDAGPEAVEDDDEMLLDEIPDSQPELEPYEIQARLNHVEWVSQLHQAVGASANADGSGRRSKTRSRRPTPEVIELDDSLQ